jgi:hypothetical protein
MSRFEIAYLFAFPVLGFIGIRIALIFEWLMARQSVRKSSSR